MWAQRCYTVTVVSGYKFCPDYPVKSILTRKLSCSPTPCNYWSAPNTLKASFILNLGSKHTFEQIQLVNIDNPKRITKQFRYKNFW